MEKTSSKRRTYKKSYFWLSVEIDMAHANVREIWYPPLTLCVKRNKARSYSWAFSKVEWGREPYQLANCSRLLKILPLLLMGPFLWGTSLWKMIPPPTSLISNLDSWFFWANGMWAEGMCATSNRKFLEPLWRILPHGLFFCDKASNVPNMRIPLAWVLEWRRHIGNPLWSCNTSKK